MNDAYVIGHVTVKDPQLWAQYRRLVAGTLQPSGAELLLRGSLCHVLSGDHRHEDTVVIHFPDRKAVQAWYASEAYQALIPMREQAAEMDLLVFEENA